MLVLLAAVAILSARGGNEPVQNANDAVTSNESIRNLEPEDRWSEGDILRALHLSDEDPEHPGSSYVTASGIRISDVLTNANAVDSHLGVSHQVVSNPTGDAGVTFSPYDSFKGSDEDAAAELADGLAALK